MSKFQTASMTKPTLQRIDAAVPLCQLQSYFQIVDCGLFLEKGNGQADVKAAVLSLYSCSCCHFVSGCQRDFCIEGSVVSLCTYHRSTINSSQHIWFVRRLVYECYAYLHFDQLT